MSESELKTDELSILELLFLSATNLNKFKWDDLLELFNCDYSESQENQLKILDGTVNHPLVKKYPLKLSYQQYFLKLIVKKLEARGIEVSEQLYQKYVELLNKDANEEAGSYHYKHYRLPNGNYITLSEKSSIISQGTTGLCSWQGALALTNWLWENKCLIEGKTILELGSGIGLAGLSLMSFCQPSHFYFSDCHPEVLKQLQTNVKLNLEQLHSGTYSTGRYFYCFSSALINHKLSWNALL
ncbi:protein-lysine N-methyltransferase EEF2KMT [Nilaparvata lugens]|uniref:protein-lysine N-methyltransferase EEF2KMT n=1 Tax=Nilaparvata lugens TaxID=108931 RepID=UPI00193D9401|nr:protein-lysine N-methyltransferase EEF2KMT [Nilaparvata lugens]